MSSLECIRKGGIDHGRQNQGGGNERDVHHDEIHKLAEVFVAKIARILFLEQTNPGILTQMKFHSTVSRVHRDHMRCAVLKQTISEAPGRCTDVETDFASNFKMPVLQGAFKFQSTTTDILRAFAEQADL